PLLPRRASRTDDALGCERGPCPGPRHRRRLGHGGVLMAKRSFDLLLAFGLVAVLSCKYDPHPDNGKQLCGASGAKQCPSGYTCYSGTCWIAADIPTGSGSGTATNPGTNTGASGSGTGTGTATGTGTGTATGTACGELNHVCCANSVCTANGTVCNGLTCEACGITGRPCCANKVCSGTGTICNAAGNCVVCGVSGYICCADDTCTGSDTVCSAGNCVPCGTSDQPCCTGNLCGASLACIGVTCQQPTPDGGVSTST